MEMSIYQYFQENKWINFVFFNQKFPDKNKKKVSLSLLLDRLEIRIAKVKKNSEI